MFNRARAVLLVVLPATVILSMLIGLAAPDGIAGPVAPLAAGAARTGGSSGSSASSESSASSPASLVNVFAGTGGSSAPEGTVGEFPAADTPFGMIQWGPDTSPDRVDGSGYSYDDHLISGLSLTHASGMGCAAYGDVPILPVSGAIGTDPEASTQPFSHQHESGAPGRYQVSLGSPAIDTQLAVTTRTGISQFTYPRTTQASLLFKTSDSAAGVSQASVATVGRTMVTGSVTSGGFCGTGSSYTLYFAASFNRPFTAEGTWQATAVTPGSTTCTGSTCGAYVTFDASSHRQVMMKVAISFVSVSGAEANLKAEDSGWSLSKVEREATSKWNALLDRIKVGGGTLTQRRTFTTALYHSLLYPNVVSDADGRYTGEDGMVHQSRQGQYANFSEWDIYRSEIQLVSLVAPEQAGAMVQSLVNDAQQDGWLPKWAIVDGDAAQMNGDSADPIIASAYAFGIRDFDARAALAAMVKGATQQESPHGIEEERQSLDQYLSQHYVTADTPDLGSITYTAGASMTLEYAIDDFSIAQMAQALGHRSLYTTMMRRAHNWEYLFNPKSGYIQARSANGSFPGGQVLSASQLDPGGETGFEEGNAIQYTWSVPQDLAGLAALMGGDRIAVGKLNALFTKLNAGRDAPYDWAGNEPNLWTPWEYDYFGAPYRTQSVTRRIMTTLYGDGPDDEPGNDDMGALSSWYVWAALGLYPVTPGTANLAIAAPLFPSTTITLPDGKRLVLHAPQASARNLYIHQITVDQGSLARRVTDCPPTSTTSTGQATRTWTSPWLPAAVLRTGGVLTYSVSSSPDATWGSAASASPPSYGSGRILALGFAKLRSSLDVHVGEPSTFQIGLKQMAPRGPDVSWQATATGGVSLSASSGTFSSAGLSTVGGLPASCPNPRAQTTDISATADAAGSGTIDVAMHASDGQTLPPLVFNVDAGKPRH